MNKVKVSAALLLSQIITVGVVRAEYAAGYTWDWQPDYMTNMLMSTPVNPAVDSEGSAVWTYAYNVNDASTATIRNTGSQTMGIGLKNGTSYVWAQNTGSWSSAAYFRATPSTDAHWVMNPGADVGADAQLAQLVWTAPTDATIKISGDIVNASTSGNGVLWYLDSYQSGTYTELGSGSVNGVSTALDVTISVSTGDQIIFSADGNGGILGDPTQYNVTYELLPQSSRISLIIIR